MKCWNTNERVPERASSLLKGLLGLPVQRIAAGGAAGSIIGVYFGRQSDAQAEENFEFYIGIECSWRLDGPAGPLTSSNDNNAPGGPMLSGLRSLVGDMVQEVGICSVGFDLAIDFRDGKSLKAFSDVVRDGCCWYLLERDRTAMSVEPAGRLVFE